MASPRLDDHQVDAAFERWWAIYPKRVKKIDAKRLFAGIVTSGKATPARLNEGAQAYAAASQQREPKYISDPTSWLMKERWTDELESASESRPQPQGSALALISGGRYD